ncbi:hypothetical protein K523DRAFT_140051 [Schizophyllum commune Tattone D]|nr:hypothetical protein K523DRAFT_140051 [Schizophyllum commune Tattone D]
MSLRTRDIQVGFQHPSQSPRVTAHHPEPAASLHNVSLRPFDHLRSHVCMRLLLLLHPLHLKQLLVRRALHILLIGRILPRLHWGRRPQLHRLRFGLQPRDAPLPSILIRVSIICLIRE